MRNRREVLTAIAVGAPLAAIAGCANLTSSQLQQDAQLISSGLSGIMADIGNVPGLNIPADVVSKVNQELTIIGQNAQQIGSVVGSPPAVAINTAVGVVASLLTPFFPMAPLIAVAVQAAVTLAATLVASAPKATRTSMSPAAARLVLESASK